MSIAAELEQWFKDHYDSEDPEWLAYVADLGNEFSVKLRELSEEHDNEGRFGMSGAGGPTRARALRYLGYEGEPFTGSTRVTFHIGHLLECVGVAALRAVGYPVRGTQERVRIDPIMSSFLDGIVTIDGEDVILSIKTQGFKKSGQQRGKWIRYGFAQLPMDGVRKSQPSWWVQSQAEMHATGMHKSLVLVVAKDIVKSMEKDPVFVENGSLTFYTETIHYDPMFAQTELLPLWQEVWEETQSEQVVTACHVFNSDTFVRLPRPASTAWDANRDVTGTYNPCVYCDYRRACKEELASLRKGVQ